MAGRAGRLARLRDEIGGIWADCGIDSEWRTLKSVLLHRPGDELRASSDPNTVQMLYSIDVPTAQVEHDALADAFRENGVKVHYVGPVGSA